MAQNAFYILDANPPAVQAVGGSLDSDTAPGGQTHAQPAFGFATHNLHGANVSRSLETSTYNRISHQRSRSLVPLFFDPDAHVGGLVCGLQVGAVGAVQCPNVQMTDSLIVCRLPAT